MVAADKQTLCKLYGIKGSAVDSKSNSNASATECTPPAICEERNYCQGNMVYILF